MNRLIYSNIKIADTIKKLSKITITEKLRTTDKPIQQFDFTTILQQM